MWPLQKKPKHFYDKAMQYLESDNCKVYLGKAVKQIISSNKEPQRQSFWSLKTLRTTQKLFYCSHRTVNP